MQGAFVPLKCKYFRKPAIKGMEGGWLLSRIYWPLADTLDRVAHALRIDVRR